MKICWNNLNKLKYDTTKKEWIDEKRQRYVYMESCSNCLESYLSWKYKHSEYCSMSCAKSNKKIHFTKEHRKNISKSLSGRKLPKETKRKISESLKEIYKNKKNHPSWKGGYNLNNIPIYDTYAPKIQWCEKVRRNRKDRNILEVKCTYCGKWYIPTIENISNRIKSLNGKYTSGSELRLYCSKQCKNECPVYRKVKYPSDFEISTSREVQPELRQMVFERDDWTCQKCGNTKSLHCHHVEGIRWEPLESADIDKCITYCKECHKEVHRKDGCGYHDFKCKEKE